MAAIQKRILQDGSIRFRVQVRVKGARQETATFERRTDAKHWAQITEARIREGKHFANSEAKRHSVSEMATRYIEQVLPDYRDVAKPKQHLLWWKKQIGECLLSDLTPALIVEHREKLCKEGKANSTANHYVVSLSRALTVALRDWGWLEDSPARKVKKLREPRGRVRFLDDDERKRLLDECKASKNTDLYLAVVLALSTGARKAETWELTWDQVDFKHKRIILHDTKNNERRSLPLQHLAYQLLEEKSRIRRLDTNLIFPSPSNPEKAIDFRRAWEEALERAEIED
ncbi:MAG: site-specific integrase, partial [bacterium]